MKKFDPEVTKHHLLAIYGIPLHMSQDLDEARRTGALAGHWAHGFLNEGVQCFLVGLNLEAGKLLEKAHVWFNAMINEHVIPKSHYAPHATESSWHEGLALVNWLYRSEHDLHNLRRFLEEDELAGVDGVGRGRIADADFIIPECYDAGEYSRGVAIYESYPDFKPPAKIDRVVRPGLMAYLLCQHRIAPRFSDEQIDVALQKFLSRRIPEWLGLGLYTQAAHWMKMIYWKEGKAGLTPLQALLKCYDYLPGLSPPPS